MWYGDWDNGMGGGFWGWFLMLTMMIAFWGGLIWFAVTLVRRPNHTSPTAAPATPKNVASKTAKEILDKRLARGEIELDDYRQRLQALQSPKE